MVNHIGLVHLLLRVHPPPLYLLCEHPPWGGWSLTWSQSLGMKPLVPSARCAVLNQILFMLRVMLLASFLLPLIFCGLGNLPFARWEDSTLHTYISPKLAEMDGSINGD